MRSVFENLPHGYWCNKLHKTGETCSLKWMYHVFNLYKCLYERCTKGISRAWFLNRGKFSTNVHNIKNFNINLTIPGDGMKKINLILSIGIVVLAIAFVIIMQNNRSFANYLTGHSSRLNRTYTYEPMLFVTFWADCYNNSNRAKCHNRKLAPWHLNTNEAQIVIFFIFFDDELFHFLSLHSFSFKIIMPHPTYFIVPRIFLAPPPS